MTYAADRSPGRIIFVYACGSTALLCPLIFGFPTEMWLAHAIFWPALALSHYAKPTSAGALLVFAAWLLLAFTHEGALVLLLAIVATLAPRGLWSATFVRAAISLIDHPDIGRGSEDRSFRLMTITQTHFCGLHCTSSISKSSK